jgi:phage-related protein
VIRHFKKLQARFYETSTGLRPVRKWLLEMPEGDRRIVGKDIQKVEFGWPIGMPYCRPLWNGLLEVRSDLTGDRIGRVIFCIVEGEMVLLHAFVKKTQRTPNREIDLALKRKRELEWWARRGARKRRIGSEETFDDFLANEGMLADAEELALKEIIADQIREAMRARGLTKTAMAARMKTDRRQLDRLLDPKNPSVTLATLRRAASAVGRSLRIELVW